MFDLTSVQSCRDELEKIAVSTGWVQKAVQQADVPKHRLMQFAEKMHGAAKDSFQKALPTIRSTGEGSAADKHNVLMRTVADSTARSRWRASPGHSGMPAVKQGSELTESARDKLPGKDFAVKAKKSNTGDEAYPIPDRQHASSALGFAKMHGDSSDLAAVRAKIKQKYPDMLKAALADGLGKEAANLLSSMGSKLAPLAEGAAAHKTELAGLGILAAPSLDEAQAHLRAGLHGDYSSEGVKKRQVLPHAAKPLSELAGLGVLAGPALGSLSKGH
jgi:hypothetical protein